MGWKLQIEFAAWFGSELQKAELAEVMGAGDGIHIHLYVHKYYWGTFFKRQNKWVPPENLTTEDATVLIEIIERHLNNLAVVGIRQLYVEVEIK